jgi:hypothetical protein
MRLEEMTSKVTFPNRITTSFSIPVGSYRTAVILTESQPGVANGLVLGAIPADAVGCGERDQYRFQQSDASGAKFWICDSNRSIGTKETAESHSNMSESRTSESVFQLGR